jgi:hypothetical protein
MYAPPLFGREKKGEGDEKEDAKTLTIFPPFFNIVL